LLYLPKKLRRFLEDYFDEHNIEFGKQKWLLYVSIVREWAKSRGFVCTHDFSNDNTWIEVSGREYKRCKWCGELVPRDVVEKVDYTRLYPKLEDLR
jgi:hypothetical protein